MNHFLNKFFFFGNLFSWLNKMFSFLINVGVVVAFVFCLFKIKISLTWLNNTAQKLKFLYVFLLIFFFALRPLRRRRQPASQPTFGNGGYNFHCVCSLVVMVVLMLVKVWGCFSSLAFMDHNKTQLVSISNSITISFNNNSQYLVT